MAGMRDPRAKAEDRPAEAGVGEVTGFSLERLIFFSDAVFAIALTLLALDLQVPDIPEPLVAAELQRSLIDLWPRVLSFAISFAVIATFWRGHHRMFGYIKRTDDRLIRRNFLLLFCVVFLPFPTSVVGRYGGTRTAVDFYALSITATSLASWSIWRYATRGRRLVAPDLDPVVIGLATVRTLVPVAVFLGSIGIAFASPIAAEISWVLTGVVSFWAVRQYRARVKYAP